MYVCSTNCMKMNKIEDSTFTVYNMTIIDAEETFRKCSPFQITRFMNTISNEWDWISYNSNGKVFTFKDYNENNALKYEKITSLILKNRSIAIAIKVNTKFNQVKGVIYSKILISMKDEEILESLESFGVNEVYRFSRNEKPTGSFAITFNNKQLPEHVKIGFLNLNVYPLYEKPMQCVHCKLLAHTRKWCLSLNDVFCQKCCHRKSDNEEHVCVEVCKNCRGNHFTDSKFCPAFQKEKLIIQLKTTKGISYNEAKRRFNLSPLTKKSDDVQLKPQSDTSSNQQSDVDEMDLNLLEKLKTEKDNLEKELQELREYSEAQSTNIQLLTSTKDILKQQNTVLIKKYEILSNVLIEAKKAPNQCQDINKTILELRKENQILKSTTEEYLKQIETTKYYSMCMKKFIDSNKHTSENFRKYMSEFMQSDSTDEE